jgi:hypothetical protein
LLNPQELTKTLTELTQENFRGVSAVFEAEKTLADAELALDLVEQKAFLMAEGSVAERTAVSKLESAELRHARDIARAQFNRVKLKLKAIESAIMASGIQAKLMTSEMKL